MRLLEGGGTSVNEKNFDRQAHTHHSCVDLNMRFVGYK